MHYAFCLLRNPDIVRNVPFNLTADWFQINGPEGYTGLFIGPVRDPVFELDMTVAGQNNHRTVSQIFGYPLGHYVLPDCLGGIKIFKFNVASKMVLVVFKNLLKTTRTILEATLNLKI
jgi:hypothetical protein